MPNCPLCNARNARHLESLSTHELNSLYEKTLGLNSVLKSDSLDYFECQFCSLKFFEPLEVGSEKFYLDLQHFQWYYMEDKQEFNMAINWINKTDTLLEVGAGSAAFYSYLDANSYTGLEFNDSAIQKARGLGINLIKESIEQHSEIYSEKYDVVAAFQVLEHVSSPYSFIQGCINCLRPGGRLVLSVPSQDGFAGLSSNHVLDMPPHHVTHWSEVTLKTVADIFNLKCIFLEHELIAPYHYKWAQSIVVSSWIKKRLGIKHRLLEDRLIVRVIEKIVGKLNPLLKLDLSSFKGHTIVAVYEKTT